MKDSCVDRIVLYLDSGGEYMNLHMITLYRTKHIHRQINSSEAGGIYISSVAWVMSIARHNATMGGTEIKYTQDLCSDTCT